MDSAKRAKREEFKVKTLASIGDPLFRELKRKTCNHPFDQSSHASTLQKKATTFRFSQ